jgi:transporter family-2 protein
MAWMLLLTVINGLCEAGSRLANAVLAMATGALLGSGINHLVGSLVASVLVALGIGITAWRVPDLAWFYFAGGCMGVLVVAANNYAIPRIGAVLGSMLLVAAQLIGSAVLDHYGVLGGAPVPMSALRLLGLALLLGGALLTLQGRQRQTSKESEG